MNVRQVFSICAVVAAGAGAAACTSFTSPAGKNAEAMKNFEQCMSAEGAVQTFSHVSPAGNYMLKQYGAAGQSAPGAQITFDFNAVGNDEIRTLSKDSNAALASAALEKCKGRLGEDSARFTTDRGPAVDPRGHATR